MPFKTGAFYIAIKTKLPIIPIVISNINNQIKLNRWNNGKIIIESLSPVNIQSINEKPQKIADYCFKIMNKKIEEINDEVNKGLLN